MAKEEVRLALEVMLEGFVLQDSLTHIADAWSWKHDRVAQLVGFVEESFVEYWSLAPVAPPHGGVRLDVAGVITHETHEIESVRSGEEVQDHAPARLMSVHHQLASFGPYFAEAEL